VAGPWRQHFGAAHLTAERGGDLVKRQRHGVTPSVRVGSAGGVASRRKARR